VTVTYFAEGEGYENARELSLRWTDEYAQKWIPRIYKVIAKFIGND